MIHTASFNYETYEDAGVGVNAAFLCDISQELSNQLSRNVRQGQYYKVVGIDMTLDIPESLPLIETTKCTVKGRLRYFAPTQGRCAAYRAGFKTVMAQMKAAGITPSKNKAYDFRVTPREIDNYYPNPVFGPIYNLATLDGTNRLSLTDGTSVGAELFDTHNLSVEPTATGTPAFSEGLTSRMMGTPLDFVLDEGFIQGGNPNIANTEMEEISFVMAWDGENEQAVPFNWRPDPALYLPIMCGHVEIVLDEIVADGDEPGPPPTFAGVEINCAIHVAGWKSIMSDPKTKSTSSTKSHGKKTSKK